MMSEPKSLGDEYDRLMSGVACQRELAPDQNLLDARDGNAAVVSRSDNCLSENHDVRVIPEHSWNSWDKSDNAWP
ncbi:hypothetical protein GZ78_22425 [Endozoicomonas numazuensis]|uniref:Uncharacterized protein n=1 Tax=Endozoicomonas numazuensis TaxID=1137799 RepID=A0A081NDR6_9GAMM|nr:hypothetical protein GZ78_22425 [Endozoicomonas numazuensis]